MHKRNFEMLNIGLISYTLFLLPTQELYRTMGIYIYFTTHTKTMQGNWLILFTAPYAWSYNLRLLHISWLLFADININD